MRSPYSTRQPDCNDDRRPAGTGRASIALCAALLFTAACSRDSNLSAVTLEGHAMGTGFEVTIIDAEPGTLLDELRGRLLLRLEQIENTASTFRHASEVSVLNRDPSTDWIRISDELCNMTMAAAIVSRESGGAFDFTVGALVKHWGFGPSTARNMPPSNRDIEAALIDSGYEKLEIDCDNGFLRKRNPALKIDLSGWAKGYAVDELALVLDAAGLKHYLVEIGGEIKVRGMNAERQAFAIAIESPAYETDAAAVAVTLRDTGIATSGSYRNFFHSDGANYSHAIDPRTGQPIKHALAAVSVIHESTAYADAMATALLVLGAEDGLVLANRLGVAAYFAVSSRDGLHYVASTAFTAGRYLSRINTLPIS